ncbi:MAG: aldehyde dehydrogenase family protein [Candidatus Kapabacteria bacterium]|nr:aldehyde dehydrogenase family protein [Candidatus Kapabacteria bacterium]
MKWYNFGKYIESDMISPDTAREVYIKAGDMKSKMRNVPLISILDILDKTGNLLSDKNSVFYKRTMEQMPEVIGYSPEMVQAGIDTLASILNYDNLMTRISVDLGDPGYLDEYKYNSGFKGYFRAVPWGIMSHVSAGNVFVGAIDTLIQGLISKNVNVLKMSGNDPVFPIIFAEALQAADPDNLIADCYGLIPFRGGDKEVEAVVKELSDAIIVYGGEDAIKAYRDGLGFHTKVIEYGPKYSLVLIDGMELHKRGTENVAELVAKDFSMWEQSACSSPHTVFITEGAAYEFANVLADKLKEWNVKIPHSKVPYQEQVEITKSRELARVEEALGNVRLIIPAINDQSWSVIYQKECKFMVSPHHRTAYVIAVKDFGEALSAIKPFGQFIQSVSIVAENDKTIYLAEEVAEIGADRITEAGMMSARKHGTPHDGGRGTLELVRWVSLGKEKQFINSFDYLKDEKRDKITLAKLNYFLRFAKNNCSYYSDKIPSEPLKNLSEISQIPVLDQKTFRNNLPPDGYGLLSRPLGNSISYGSGGTTGNPKFIYRTIEENKENARLIGKGYALSIFDENDVVANLLFAGNMWASFVSHNLALEYTGCHILPLAGNIPMENMVSTIRAFNANGVISIPSVIISLAQYVENNKIDGVKITKVVSGGEHLFPEAKEYIAKVLGTEVFASTGYLSNDTGAIGFQTEFEKDGYHLIHEDYCLMEVVDPDTNQPVPTGQPGKILVTNFTRKLMPLIRYDIGDMGRLVETKSKSGRTLRMMELLGRSDDVLIIGGANIALESVAKSIAKVKGLSYHFRMTAELDGMLDKFVLEVETVDSLPDDEKLKLQNAMYDSLIMEKPEFAYFLKSGSISNPEVKVINPGELPRNPRTGKIKQVIDSRKGYKVD